MSKKQLLSYGNEHQGIPRTGIKKMKLAIFIFVFLFTMAGLPAHPVQAAPTPAITVTANLTPFYALAGSPSMPQTYTVSGSNLSGNITITAPTGFQLSTTGTTYSNSLTLTRSGKTIATTTIYVHLTGTSAGSFNGNIVHTTPNPNTGQNITENLTVSGMVGNCYPLTISHTGLGSDPVANPVKTPACPNDGQYFAGFSISLTGAAPDTGWYISGWTGTDADTITATTNSLTMPARSASVAVNYTAFEYTLTVNSDHGTVTRSPNQSSYHYGDVVTLSMAADPGWTFTGWTPALTNNQVTIQGNTTVTANFTQNHYTLTVNSAHATVTRSPDQATYLYGDIVTLNLTNVEPGWNFTGWSPALVNNQVTIQGDTSITANFSQIEYTLTVNSAHGTITRTPNQPTYHYGDVVTLSVVPAAGWTFIGWTPALTNNQVIIQGDTTVTANYTQNNYSLTVNSAHGSVTRTPDQASYHYGDVVTLSVSADPGWTFTGWSPVLAGNQVTIQGDTTVTANFSQNEYSLTIDSAHGTVTRSPDQATYHYGDVVTLNMTSVEPGWTFAGWTPALTNNQITIQADVTVTASFTQNNYSLNVSAAHGAVTRSPDQATYHYGDVVTLSVVSDAGWTFTGWTPALTNNQVTILGDTTITADFAQIEYSLTIHSAHGTPARTPDQPFYHYGDVVTLNMTGVEPGWTFTGWTPDLTNNQVTIQGNTTVTANFSQNNYTLTVNAAHGTVSKSPDQELYHYGDVVTLNMAAVEPGWTFTGWTPELTDNQVTIQGDTTITANFTQNTYTLTVVSPHGTVSKSPDQEVYHYGDVVSLSMGSVDPGWTFTGWTPELTNDQLTIQGDTTVTAGFSQIEYTLTVTSDHGTVTRTPEKTTYHYGDVVTLTVVPDAGWSFAGWTPELAGDQVTIQGDTSVAANFTQIEYTLTIVSAHGQVNRAPDQETYHYGDVVTLTMTSVDKGWAFSGWTPELSGNQVTIQSDTTITANFTPVQPDCFALTIRHDGMGSDPAASPAKSADCPADGQYVAGEIITLSGASPSYGWEINGWSGTDNDSSKLATNTLTMPASPLTVSVTYAKTMYYLYLPMIAYLK